MHDEYDDGFRNDGKLGGIVLVIGIL